MESTAETSLERPLRADAERNRRRILDAAADPDPWEGLVRFIDAGAEFHGRNRALKELMFSAPGGREWVDRVRTAVRPKVARVVRAAQAQGSLRDDLNVLDVPLVELVLAAGIEFTDRASNDAWRRVL